VEAGRDEVLMVETMIIEAVESKVDFPPYKHIQMREAWFCCDRMMEAWFMQKATFGDTLFSTVNACIKVRIQPFNEKMLGTAGSIVDRCPYCGARIEVNVEARIDAQEL